MTFPPGTKSHMLAKTPEERAEFDLYNERNTLRGEEVFLNRQEMAQASYVGALRWVVACGETYEKRRSLHNEAERIGRGMLQSVACAAVAKALGVYWLGQWGHPEVEDIVGPLDVHYLPPDRTVVNLSADDSAQRDHCFVTGRAPRMRIIGTISGHLAMSPRFTVIDDQNPEKGTYQRIQVGYLIPFATWRRKMIEKMYAQHTQEDMTDERATDDEESSGDSVLPVQSTPEGQ